jgi:pantoate--beta-alanine ligase
LKNGVSFWFACLRERAETARVTPLQARRDARQIAAGKTAGAGAIAWGLKELEAAGFTRIDYLEVRDAETLEPVDKIARPARVLAAVWVGQIRLIDNMAVEPAG